jgi:hypothetical protein
MTAREDGGKTALDEFWSVLKDYRKLSAWVAGGSIVLPFVTWFLGVVPPWPAGIQTVTAVFQLVALIVAFQTYRHDHELVTKVIAAFSHLTFRACYRLHGCILIANCVSP